MLSLDRYSIVINNSPQKYTTSMSVIERMIDECLICKVSNSESILLIPPSGGYFLCSKCKSLPTQGSLVVIQVPPKFWRPKMQNRYIPPDYVNGIDKEVFYFQQYGKAVYRPKKSGKKVGVQI